MAPTVPSDIDWCTVNYVWNAVIADTADVGTEPDVSVPADAKVVLTLESTGGDMLYTGVDGPRTFSAVALTCTFNANGEMIDSQSSVGIKLLPTAGQSDILNPQSGVDGILTWKAVRTATGFPLKSWSFEAPAGETIDLTEETPVPNGEGTYYLVGPKGDPGADPDLSGLPKTLDRFGGQRYVPGPTPFDNADALDAAKAAAAGHDEWGLAGGPWWTTRRHVVGGSESFKGRGMNAVSTLLLGAAGAGIDVGNDTTGTRRGFVGDLTVDARSVATAPVVVRQGANDEISRVHVIGTPADCTAINVLGSQNRSYHKLMVAGANVPGVVGYRIDRAGKNDYVYDAIIDGCRYGVVLSCEIPHAAGDTNHSEPRSNVFTNCLVEDGPPGDAGDLEPSGAIAYDFRCGVDNTVINGNANVPGIGGIAYKLSVIDPRGAGFAANRLNAVYGTKASGGGGGEGLGGGSTCVYIDCATTFLLGDGATAEGFWTVFDLRHPAAKVDLAGASNMEPVPGGQLFKGPAGYDFTLEQMVSRYGVHKLRMYADQVITGTGLPADPYVEIADLMMRYPKPGQTYHVKGRLHFHGVNNLNAQIQFTGDNDCTGYWIFTGRNAQVKDGFAADTAMSFPVPLTGPGNNPQVSTLGGDLDFLDIEAWVTTPSALDFGFQVRPAQGGDLTVEMIGSHLEVAPVRGAPMP